MNLAGNTTVVINGKNTRVLSSFFNEKLKKNNELHVFLPSGEKIAPSKNMSWHDAAKLVRQGKKVVCRMDVVAKSRNKKAKTVSDSVDGRAAE